MTKMFSFILSVALALSVLLVPVSAASIERENAASTVSIEQVSPRGVEYRHVTETRYYTNYSDIPEQYNVVKYFTSPATGEVISYTGTMHLTSTVNRGNSWEANFAGDLIGYY